MVTVKVDGVDMSGQELTAYIERLERKAAAGRALADGLRAHELAHGLDMAMMLLLMEYDKAVNDDRG